MSKNGLKNTKDVDAIIRESEKSVKKLTKLLALLKKQVEMNGENLGTKNTQKVKKADPIGDALKGRLKHRDTVKYGYQINKDGKKVPLNWSYMEIDGEKYFVCTDVIAQIEYSKDGDNNWERSDLKKALDENLFRLYSGPKSPLGKDPRIDSGVTILSREEYLKIIEELPKTDSWYWLCSPSRGSSYSVSYVGSGGSIYDSSTTTVSGRGGVRPAFRLKSES